MSAVPLDDYLLDLLGAASAPAVVGAVPAIETVAPVEAVVDVLVAPPVATRVAAPIAARAVAVDAIAVEVAPVVATAPAIRNAPSPMPASSPATTPAPAPALPVRPAIAHPALQLPASLLQTPPAEDSFHRRRTSDRATRWLRLRCDHQHYALELLKVQEVILPGLLLPLRGAPRHMLGVMNLRGHVVPVMDLGLYLGREACSEDASTRIVVLEENGDVLGLRVTAVEDVTKINDQQIEPPDDTRISRITNQVFRGVARLGEHTIILLDASRLLQ